MSVTVGAFTYEFAYIKGSDKVSICVVGFYPKLCGLYTREDLEFYVMLPLDIMHDVYVQALTYFPKKERGNGRK